MCPFFFSFGSLIAPAARGIIFASHCRQLNFDDLILSLLPVELPVILFCARRNWCTKSSLHYKCFWVFFSNSRTHQVALTIRPPLKKLFFFQSRIPPSGWQPNFYYYQIVSILTLVVEDICNFIQRRISLNNAITGDTARHHKCTLQLYC